MEAKILLFVGRLARVKNLEALLKAFAILIKSMEGMCRLVLVGPEAEVGYKDALQETSLRLGVADHVIFVGAVPHRSTLLADLYAASDVVAIPSRYEAQPVSILEAWGAGRAVVVADVGGAGAMVREWGAGFLWSPGGDSRDLAQILCQALTDWSTEMEEKIRRAREYYSAQRMVKDYVALYQAVVGD
nr:glycosyltransferase family 4 protein [Rhodothermus bifroesti]